MKVYISVLFLALLMMLTGCQNPYTGNSGISDYPVSDPIIKSDVLYNRFDGPSIDADAVFLDTSRIDEGYISAALKEDENLKIKLRIIKDEEIYTYDILETEMKSFPLNLGNGIYTIKVYRQIEGDSYALLYSTDLYVELNDDLLPYLYPNQIVDYKEGSMIVDKSFEITEGDDNDLQRVYDLFVYTLDSLSYDSEKAAMVKTIYMLPDIDGSIASGKGICFDYASIMAALCRVQHIPSKVVVGYTDIEYHSWVEIYLENYGWVNPKLIFNSKEWSLVDPTFADSGRDYEGNYDEVYHY